ncbi:hypothetical protein N7510_011476 [Penicillium lagena]|uniref:uncharacterized protein n=1 Tax=Penicillium lagena TaxID=94218 RepID=UPI0025416973|nr:uncharacterized protein N7510_011476 [Penicillium lagena]KAJ5601942.1 hypothetical protein N7510_011476 [Penicillium lagena]
MPTDQREPFDTLLQMKAPQPYSPCPSVDAWPRFRSTQESPMPLHHLHPELWSAAIALSEPYALSSHSPYLDSYDATSSNPTLMASPSTVAPLSPGLHRQHMENGDHHLSWMEEALASPSSLQEYHQHHHPRPNHYNPNPTQMESLDLPEMRASPPPLFEIASYLSQAASGPSIHGPMTISSPEPAPSRENSAASESSDDQPYSKLIYEALVSAENKKLPLQGIYNWFEKHTAKSKDPSSKGWQNSIRHNLSMNAGFEAIKEEAAPGKKAVNFWRLTQEALEQGGVHSTTRYRKANHKRHKSSSPPALPQRHHHSGSKAGAKASRSSAAKIRHSTTTSTSQDELLRKDQYRARPPVRHLRRQLQQQTPHHDHPSPPRHSHYAPIGPSPVAMMQAHHTMNPAETNSSPVRSFDPSMVIGCASLPMDDTAPVFVDAIDVGTGCLAFDDPAYPSWIGLQYYSSNGLARVPDVSHGLPPGIYTVLH